MIKAEVIIDPAECSGCGYCAVFCPRECLSFSGEKFNDQGYPLPTFSHPEWCNTCSFCAIMCPAAAIEVYITVSP